MAQTEATIPDPALLPDVDHTLLPAEKLVHGKFNPRRVPPKAQLRQSIKGSGIYKPLIVRPDPTEDMYHVMDGWQRYQAATDHGWELLPVTICETVLEAFQKTNAASIGRREWTIYNRARFCRDLYTEFKTDNESKMATVRQIAELLDRSANAVRRYINVLSLPEEIHPLLTNGPEGTSAQWDVLKNYNDDVRRYKGLQWQVADVLATRQSEISSTDRLIAIATTAVEFDDPDDATAFIKQAAAEETQPLNVIRQEIISGGAHERHLIVPRVAVKLSPNEKQAIMHHCHQHRRQLTDIVTESITSLATELIGDETVEES